MKKAIVKSHHRNASLFERTSKSPVNSEDELGKNVRSREQWIHKEMGYRERGERGMAEKGKNLDGYLGFRMLIL